MTLWALKEKLQDSISAPFSVTDMVFFLQNWKKLLEDFYIKVEIHEVNPFDFIECLNKTIELIQSEPDKDKAVNVTGGTKTLSLAAHSAAWMCGCRAFIIMEKGTGVAIKEEFPIPAAGYPDKISKQMKRILEHLLRVENALS
jgi:CRISPR-associated protein Csa3